MTAPAPASPFRKGSAGTLIDLRVIPRSPKNVVGGIRDGRLLVRVTAPPVDEAANEAVTRLIAGALNVPKGAVTLVSGHTARNKVVEVRGVSLDAAADLLL
jgi:uncharacterized protein (TIGR00251 family)